VKTTRHIFIKINKVKNKTFKKEEEKKAMPQLNTGSIQNVIRMLENNFKS